MDSRDNQPEFIPEDLSVNDIESISEFVAEVLLGADGLFIEHDEHDYSARNTPATPLFTCEAYSIAVDPVPYNSSIQYFISDILLFAEGVEEITSPPPQVLNVG